MDRRFFLTLVSSAAFSSKAFAAQAWSAKFVVGGFDGTAYQAGLHIKLDAGWKTYWRNPGEAGIPPNIAATAENLETIRIDYPLPQRIVDESGEAIGFHNEVLFPLYLIPKDTAKPIDAKMSAFFGVCQQICSPAKLDSEIKFTPSSQVADLSLIQKWQAQVPKAGVISDSLKVENGYLVLSLTDKFDDIFVEGSDLYYFGKPDFTREAGKAWIKVAGLKSATDLKGVDLRITSAKSGTGLEQHMMVA